MERNATLRNPHFTGKPSHAPIPSSQAVVTSEQQPDPIRGAPQLTPAKQAATARRGRGYPKATRWATSRHCQCSSGLKYVRTSSALAARNASANTSTFRFDAVAAHGRTRPDFSGVGGVPVLASPGGEPAARERLRWLIITPT
jgi:hypothetical protein